MPRKRRTKSEREEKWYESQRKAWEKFRPMLEGIGSFRDAFEVLKGMPAPDTPPRKYYTNLLYFVETLSPPGNSSYDEKFLYIGLVKKLADIGELSKQASLKVESSLRKAMENQFGW